MHTILVTGGAGFIGSHFIEHVLESDPQAAVINLDALTYAAQGVNLLRVIDNPRYLFAKGNICDAQTVDAVMKHATYVVHFAAETHVDRSIEGPAEFVKTNVLGTQVLLDAARKYGIKRFVQISTDEVYGSLGPKGSFTERSLLAPNSPYSASKAGSDMLARSYWKTYGLDLCVTRCSNNFGPHQFSEKLIPVVIKNALEDKPIPVYGDGMNVRDWIHVKDHCAAVYKVLTKGKAGEVYNIGTANEMPNLVLIKKILAILGKPESLISFVTDRLGHDRRYAIDPTKVRKELDWEPRVDFDQGLAETVAWYRDFFAGRIVPHNHHH
jgi:dTDP-glucose 4,6-dehydratase